MSIPQARILNAIDEFLLQKFTGEGFRFSPSQLTFNKKIDTDFVYEVKFVPSKNNWSDEVITYDVNYQIYSPRYLRWCKVNFPNLVTLGGGYLSGDISMTMGSKPGYRNVFGYDFVAYSSELIMSEIWLDYQNYWHDYFEMNNSWEKINRGTQQLHLKIDSLILLDRKDEALFLINTHLDLRRKGELDEKALTGNLSRDLSFLHSRLGYLLYIRA